MNKLLALLLAASLSTLGCGKTNTKPDQHVDAASEEDGGSDAKKGPPSTTNEIAAQTPLEGGKADTKGIRPQELATPQAKIMDEKTWAWAGSQHNFARCSTETIQFLGQNGERDQPQQLEFAFEVGMGNEKNGVGIAEVGLEIENADRISVTVDASPLFRRRDDNSYAGFIVDYHTAEGYTKRVALPMGFYSAKKWGKNPGWGKSTAPEQFVDLGRHKEYDLDLKKWAPDGWDGRVWFSVSLQNSGRNTKLKGKIHLPTEEDRLLATKVVGRFIFSGSGTPWEFTKEGRAIENGKDMGAWRVMGGKVIITYSDKRWGLAVLSLKDDNTLGGKNEHRDGAVFNWVLEREKTEVAQRPKEETAKEANRDEEKEKHEKIAAAEREKREAAEKVERDRLKALALAKADDQLPQPEDERTEAGTSALPRFSWELIAVSSGLAFGAIFAVSWFLRRRGRSEQSSRTRIAVDSVTTVAQQKLTFGGKRILLGSAVTGGLVILAFVVARYQGADHNSTPAPDSVAIADSQEAKHVERKDDPAAEQAKKEAAEKTERERHEASTKAQKEKEDGEKREAAEKAERQRREAVAKAEREKEEAAKREAKVAKPVTVKTPTKTKPVLLPHKGLHCAAFSPDGCYLATASFDAITIWDLKDGKEIRKCVPEIKEDPERLYNTPKGARDVAFSKDGKVLYAHDWRSETANLKRSIISTIFVFDATSGKQVRYFDLGVSGFIMFSADGELLAYRPLDFQRKQVDVRKSETGKIVHQFNMLKIRGTDVADVFASTCISPDNKRLLLAGGYGRLSSLEDGKEIRVLQWPDKQFRPLKVAFCPDAKRTLMAFKNKVIIFNTDSEKEEQTLEGNIDGMWTMAVSLDGKLALGGGKGTVMLWNLENGKQVRRHADVPANVTCVTFSPKGDSYALCTRDTVMIYLLPKLP